MSSCKHCEKTFTNKEIGNHSRWCDLNPKRKEYKDGSLKAIEAMNIARKKSGVTNQFTKARLGGNDIPEHPNKGKEGIGSFLGRTHTEETKQVLREKALASPHRRLRKGIVEYRGVKLDSSWELALAKRLDELEIEWIRPRPIRWIDKDGVGHNYFGDFYLPEHDLYLDPKNPHAIKVQKEKLHCLLLQHKNIVIIDSLEKCKNYSL